MNRDTSHPTNHRMTTTDATAVQLAYDSHAGEPGGILIIDRPEGLKAHYTSNPGNMAGRMVMLDTLTPIEPKALRTPANLAAAINAALDDAEDGTDDRDQTSAESGTYWNEQAARAVQEDREALHNARMAIEAETDAKLAANGFDPMGNKLTTIEAAHAEALAEEAERAEARTSVAYWKKEAGNMDNARAMWRREAEAATKTHRTTMEAFEGAETTPRTYETTTLALELSNIETLYTGARQEIRAARAIQQADIQISDGQALQQFVANILEDQNTRNSKTALLVALANAATARIDWADVAEQLSEDL